MTFVRPVPGPGQAYATRCAVIENRADCDVMTAADLVMTELAEDVGRQHLQSQVWAEQHYPVKGREVLATLGANDPDLPTMTDVLSAPSSLLIVAWAVVSDPGPAVPTTEPR